MTHPTTRRPSGRSAALDAVRQLLERSSELSGPACELVETLASELERGHDELREIREKYQALVEQIPAIVYVDKADDSMVTTYVSPQLEALLGIPPQEYMDDPHMWTRHLHPDDRDRALATYQAGRRSGRPFSFEYRLIARDGRIVWFRDSAVVLRDEDGNPTAIEGVMLDITELRAAEEQATFLAYHDRVTGLPNRAMFEELLDLAIARARRHDLAVAVLLADIDDFKLVNESLGHDRGDELLRQLAVRLREATRETDIIARPGGDEFLVLIADIESGGRAQELGSLDGAVLIAEAVASRVQEALQAPFDVDGTEIYVQASLGIALFPQHATDPPELLGNADAAMYQSKEAGPGGYVVYSDAGADALGKLSFTTRLRKAVEHQHWELHYQPIIALAGGTMTGVEALIRWSDPNGGLVPPGEFIPLAEEMGLIELIGEWVIEELVRQDQEWRREGLDLELSFNLSPRQLWQPEIANRIIAGLTAGAVDPTKVIVEVTESSALTDPDRTLRILWDLHSRGLRLAIDDFGTGYSSLSRLKHLPVDILKIDRSFVRELQSDRKAASMVQAIVQLADGLGMTALAEGIETRAEWRSLVEHGCRLGQGYYFCRPVPASGILARHRRAAMQAVGAGPAA